MTYARHTKIEHAFRDHGFSRLLSAACLGLLSLHAVAQAPTQPPAPGSGQVEGKPPTLSRTERADRMQSAPVQSFVLKNSTQPNGSNEILTGLRLLLDPAIKIYLVPRDNIILIRALPDDLALAAKLIAELDVPRKPYRLTYIVSELDGTRRISQQHFTLAMLNGQRVTLKQGSKVPVATGKYDVSTSTAETQMTYLDVGWNFDATLNEASGGGQLKTKVERSTLSDEKSGAGPQDPIVLQTVLEGVMLLQFGKTSALGTLDLPGGTHHLEIEAKLEATP